GAHLRARVHLRARPVARRLLREGPRTVRRALLLVTSFALLFPAASFARGDFDPTVEFEQHEWVPIHLGGLNMSITKAVVYLMIGSVLTILLGIGLMRHRLTSKAIGRWFPYVATLLLFIWVVNMLGFVPLPLTGERWHGVPTWGIYAATSSLSVTLAL